MKKISFIAIALVFASCSSDNSNDTNFCSCLEAGEELNNYTQQFFEKEPTQEEADKLKELKELKKSACQQFETMGGDEMRKLKADCEE